MKMKTISAIILISLSLPLLVMAGDPIAITLPVSGFVETVEAQNLTIAGTIERGFWDNPISKRGGTIIVYASAGGNQVSKQLKDVEPIFNPMGKITGYTFAVSLDVESLRGETALPLKVSVEAKNHSGELVDYDEVWGTIEPNLLSLLEVTLSPNTPASALIPKGSAAYNFTKITFTAGEQEDVRVNQLVLTRYGGTDDDLLNISVFDGASGTMLGRASSFTNGKATITGISLVIPKGLNKTLVIKADIGVNANTYSKEDGIAIGITNASDIQAISNASGENIIPSGSFPLIGNSMGITLAE